MQTTSIPVYAEGLKARPKPLVIILAVSTVLVVGLPAIFNGLEWSRQEALTVIGVAAFMGVIWFFVLISRIQLRLTAEGVSYQLWPLKKHTARWEELQEWYVRKVDTFGEFGGWGLRYAFNRAWGYVNASPWGLQLVRKDNTRITISTRRPNELRAWLERYAPSVGH